MPDVVNPDPWLPPADSGLPGVPAVAKSVFHNTGSALIPLPNVEVMGVKDSPEGPIPGTATFRYNLTSGLSGAPSTLEEALDKSFTGPLVIEPGWRLTVAVTRQDGVSFFLFDGIALDFGGHWDRHTEEVTIVAHAWPKMLFNSPLPGQLIRNSGKATSTDSADTYQSDVIAQPNVRGNANCSPKGSDTVNDDAPEGEDFNYPNFLDPSTVAAGIEDEDWTPQDCTWTLNRLARLLFYQYGGTGIDVFPSGDFLDNLLVSQVPNSSSSYNPSDPSTYAAMPIAVSDVPMNGRYWPTYLYDQLHPYGFGMHYELASSDAGMPQWKLRLYRKISRTVKSIYLQPRGTPIDPWASNVEHAKMGRDLTDVINSWRIEGALVRYEASFVLSQGFKVDPSDVSNAASFSRNNDEETSYSPSAYRLYVCDESGEGHFLMGGLSGSSSSTAPDLSPILGTNGFSQRRRRPLGHLISIGKDGKPRRPRLWISQDFEGTYPGLWDGTGTWYEVETGWRPLKDRIGVYVYTSNPNEWKFDEEPLQDGNPWRGGIIKAIQSLAAPNTKNPIFFLRLTCTIEDDDGLIYTAQRTSNSPLSYSAVRVEDARDRYRKDVITGYTDLSLRGETDDPVVFRDDTPLMKAEASAMQIDSQAGVMSLDPVVIPYITTYYEIGDRISGFVGRSLSFRTDNGDSTWAPTYPCVVGRHWEFGAQQRTILTLSDKGLDRHGRRVSESQAATHAALAHTSGSQASSHSSGALAGGTQAGHSSRASSPIDYSQGGMIRVPPQAQPPAPAPASGMGGGLGGPDSALPGWVDSAPGQPASSSGLIPEQEPPGSTASGLGGGLGSPGASQSGFGD